MADEFRKNGWRDKVQPNLDLIAGWARHGLSDKQICLNLGIGETTFYGYLKSEDKLELQAALDLGRRDADILVENALFKRAIGFKYDEITRERVKEFDEDDKWTGKFVMKITKKVTKMVVPDVEAQKYWLEHRSPRRWEKNPLPGVDLDNLNTNVNSLAQLLRNPVPEREIGSENDD